MKKTKPFSFSAPTRIEYGAGKVCQLVDETKGLNAKRPLDRVINLLRMLRIPTLKDVGIKESDFEEISKIALVDPMDNPRKMTLDGIMEVVRDAYEDKFRIALERHSGERR